MLTLTLDFFRVWMDIVGMKDEEHFSCVKTEKWS